MSDPSEVRVKKKIYDELSVLWTRGKNKGRDEERENIKGVGQMTNRKRGKSNETRSVSQCGEIMFEDEEMRSSKEEASQAQS